ncbi:MAG TPA: hypothetical protein VF898_03215 [Chloroflexota bacterium]
MTRHSTYLKMLARRLELSAEQEMQLQKHLHDCAECRESAAIYARQTALLRSLPVETAPPALRAGVFQGIQTGTPRPALPLRWASPLLAALMIALAAVAYINHFNRSHLVRSALTHPSLVPRPVVEATLAPPGTAPPPQVAIPRKHSSRSKARHPNPTPVPTVGPVPAGNAPASIAQALSTGASGSTSLGALQPAQSSISRATAVHARPSLTGGKGVPHTTRGRNTAARQVPPTPKPSPVPVATVAGASTTTSPTAAPTSPVIVLHIRPTPVPAEPPPAYPTPPPAPSSHPTPVAESPALRPATPVPTPTPPS